MSDVLVRVEGVSKKFCRDLKRSLWYGVKDVANELSGRQVDRLALRSDEFWAVQDVSFHVERGETLGLIGHNGAGKTTLLRMLNGLIKPDAGFVEMHGRTQALIALGAGFNPVLTGRENIQVNAAVLGISGKELARRYDEIVEFSGIEEFMDMPVQSYSSGMVVRLGFSVAAHLEPDVLLVDEVLAVGDLAFKTKCQMRIQELKDRGVAIVFVSHNLHAVSHVCTRAVALERGQVIYDGDTERAIDAYRASLTKLNKGLEKEIRAGTGEIRVRGVDVLNEQGVPSNEFEIGDFARFRIHFTAEEAVENPVFNIAMHVLNSHQVTGIRTDVDDVRLGTVQGAGYVDIVVPNLNFLPNMYTVDAVVFHPDGFTFIDRVNLAAELKVRGGLLVNGTAYLPHSWELAAETSSTITPDSVAEDGPVAV